ncbi:gephyrin-like molybdotransferase Glp [Actinokineospora sp. NBRC 105648]|uniref:molybdopterin molybdotransferase MoeA n=1 Tax=Actinokineospora sp. NBRC 105648 TaxID=3032206 RepID=UPI0025546FD7|nr:gephyrin-like molybdotransferase Glp [Actinokineospora sp. NBRC 105648]
MTPWEYRQEVAALLPALPVESLPLARCRGLVLAEDVVAGVSLPPFDNSAMDGYAVRSSDVAGAPLALPVADDIPAGRVDVRPLAPGTVQRIMTGAPMPAGADAVVQVELTDGGTDTVLIEAAVAARTHVRFVGEDVTAGTVVLRAGTVLHPPQLGLAAAVGIAALPVRRPPRVLILSTGSELVAAGEPLPPGHIYESNSVLLAAAVEEIGGEATVLRFVPDDVSEFRAAITEHAASADLLVTSGGVSAGAYEVVKDALTGHGVEFVRVAIQPGGPQGRGVFDGLPVVTFPGNPVSAALSFELFLRPALLSALGHTVVDRPRVRATATAAMTSPPNRVQYRRGRHDAGTVEVVPVGGPGSHLLAAFAASNCLIEIPDGVSEVRAGDEVDLILLD